MVFLDIMFQGAALIISVHSLLKCSACFYFFVVNSHECLKFWHIFQAGLFQCQQVIQEIWYILYHDCGNSQSQHLYARFVVLKLVS